MQNSSKTDWARVKREALTDKPVPVDEDDLYDPNSSEAVDAFWDNAEVRRPGERGPQKAPTKARISLRLSPEVVEYFKADGAGWQTRMDAALKEYVRQHQH